MIQIQLRNDRVQEKADVIVAEFRNMPEVVNAAASTSGLGGDTDGKAYFPEGESDTEPWLLINSGIDFNYIETLEMEFILSRNFSPDFVTDTAALILNETLWKKLGRGGKWGA